MATADNPMPRPRTFNETFGNCTVEERTALVWYLAAMRARKTVEALLPTGGSTDGE